jgi:glutamate dehydrogenase/leucine dehydrogenase
LAIVQKNLTEFIGIHVNYVKGANVAGFMKVAKAMMAQGIL